MNYDMVGSPNCIFMVYDADQSTSGARCRSAVDAIEDLYESFYTLSVSRTRHESVAATREMSSGIPTVADLRTSGPRALAISGERGRVRADLTASDRVRADLRRPDAVAIERGGRGGRPAERDEQRRAGRRVCDAQPLPQPARSALSRWELPWSCDTMPSPS